MANTTLQYIRVDYQSHKDAILQRIRSRYPLLWTDFSNSNFGVILVDIIAWSMATFGYIVNRIAGENYITTMTLRESAVRIGALVNYKLRGPVSAVVACQAVVPNDSPSRILNITIPKGTQVKTNDGNNLVFEVAKDYEIIPGQATPIAQIVTISAALTTVGNIQTGVIATKGSVYLDLQNGQIDLTQYIQPGQTIKRFDPSGGSLPTIDTTAYAISAIESAPDATSYNRIVLNTPYLGASGTFSYLVYDTRIELVQGKTVVDQFVSPAVETPNYKVQLSSSPLIEGSVEVAVNGIAWTEVDSLLTQTSAATVFSVSTLATGEVMITFGDGIFGSLVPTQASVTLTYRIGGGAVGNVQIGAISTQINGVISPLNSLVAINITNTTNAGVGGQDEEGLEEARANIPASIKANGQAVSLQDYETLASLYVSPTGGAVRFARAAVRTQNSLLEGNIVVVYAWTSATGGGLTPVTGTLQTDLQTYLNTVKVGTDYVLVSTGISTPFPLAVRIQATSGSDVNTVIDNVSAAVTAMITTLRPGDSVIFSDLVQLIAGTTGVSNIIVATPVTNLYPNTSLDLYTPPDSTKQYTLPIASAPPASGGFNYSAQSPVFPLTPWSFNATLNGQSLVVVPDVEPGYARLHGTALFEYGEGLAANRPDATAAANSYYLATDVGVGGTLYVSNGTVWTAVNPGIVQASRVNLATGAVSLSVNGSPGTFTMSLNSYQAYTNLRPIDLYVGYSGDNTPVTRAAIRQALRTWADGFAVGASMYGTEQAGILESKANVENVLLSISGVTSVNRVAFGSPASIAVAVTASGTDLLTLGNIILNNSQD